MKALSEFQDYFNLLFITHIRSCVAGVLDCDPDFAPIGEHLILLAQGGKRLRPFVAKLAYQSGGGVDIARIVPALFALELFQLFALIHDDIMDGASTRHQVECLHKKFDYKQALLVGNLCLVWAMRSIGTSAYTTQKELNIFLKLSEETNIGQMIDTTLGQKSIVTEDLLERSIDLKTARYTFVYPISLGLSYAGVDSEIDVFCTMGKYLGFAFQRLDDLADVMFSKALLGKNPCADIVDGTSTFLSYHFNNYASEKDRKKISQYYGQTLSDIDVATIQQLFIRSGSVLAEVEAVKHYLSQAEAVLYTLGLSCEYSQLWSDCIRFLRDKLNMMPKTLS